MAAGDAELRMDLGAFAKLIEPFIARSAQKSVDRDYDRLVQLLETSASTDSTENSPSE